MKNKHMKRCSTLVFIWEVQIKTTMRQHYISLRITEILKTEHMKFGKGMEELGL